MAPDFCDLTIDIPNLYKYATDVYCERIIGPLFIIETHIELVDLIKQAHSALVPVDNALALM